MYTLLIFIILFYFLLIQVKLLSLTQIKYEKKNSLLEKEHSLLVCSHDYEQNDVFIMINEFILSKKKVTFVLADITGHQILYYYLRFIGVFNIDFIFITDGTVNKMVDALREDNSVVTFLRRDDKSHGIYYTLVEEDVPVYLCKITSDYLKKGDYSSLLQKYTFNFNKEYKIEYDNYNNKIIDNEDVFMNNIMNQLYN